MRIRLLGPRETDARGKAKQPMLQIYNPGAEYDPRARDSVAQQFAVLEELIGTKWTEVPFIQD